MFFVIEGKLKIELRDKTLTLSPNEFTIIPKGVEHKPVADEEVAIMLFEPASTLNTGDTINEFTKKDLQKSL
jgi:mannose-6-phosphate isomerase-like protein (cupin superfamily)